MLAVAVSDIEIAGAYDFEPRLLTEAWTTQTRFCTSPVERSSPLSITCRFC
jgi:hypothetical protein